MHVIGCRSKVIALNDGRLCRKNYTKSSTDRKKYKTVSKMHDHEQNTTSSDVALFKHHDASYFFKRISVFLLVFQFRHKEQFEQRIFRDMAKTI